LETRRRKKEEEEEKKIKSRAGLPIYVEVRVLDP
jgi:hypothetical protein